MMDKIKQMMEIKKQADRMKRELESATIEVGDSSHIKILMNGAQQLKSVEIHQSLLEVQNKQKLESELVRSFNAAIAKSQMLAAQKMKDLTGLNLPGF